MFELKNDMDGLNQRIQSSDLPYIHSLSPVLDHFSDSVNDSATALGDPSLEIFRRTNRLPTQLCSSCPNAMQLIALNRRLDELEGILSSAARYGIDQGEARAPSDISKE